VGLTDALVGRADLDDLLQEWGDGTLKVLASGPTPPNPSELLGSEQMGELLAELEKRCDLVLLDAPPLLPVTDAAVLTAHASGAIMIVRSGQTTREQALRAVEILRGVDAHVYGVVINMVPTKGPGAYKYGYYGYGYASNAPVTELPPSRARTRATDRPAEDLPGSTRVRPPAAVTQRILPEAAAPDTFR
jgi:succinoglycan biosynthesis transport protein ExoP